MRPRTEQGCGEHNVVVDSVLSSNGLCHRTAINAKLCIMGGHIKTGLSSGRQSSHLSGNREGWILDAARLRVTLNVMVCTSAFQKAPATNASSGSLVSFESDFSMWCFLELLVEVFSGFSSSCPPPPPPPSPFHRLLVSANEINLK